MEVVVADKEECYEMNVLDCLIRASTDGGRSMAVNAHEKNAFESQLSGQIIFDKKYARLLL